MASSLLGDRSRGLWVEEKTRSIATYYVPSVIHEVRGSAAIGNVVRYKYQQLHDSVFYDIGEMDGLLEEL